NIAKTAQEVDFGAPRIETSDVVELDIVQARIVPQVDVGRQDEVGIVESRLQPQPRNSEPSAAEACAFIPVVKPEETQFHGGVSGAEKLPADHGLKAAGQVI